MLQSFYFALHPVTGQPFNVVGQLYDYNPSGNSGLSEVVLQKLLYTTLPQALVSTSDNTVVFTNLGLPLTPNGKYAFCLNSAVAPNAGPGGSVYIYEHDSAASGSAHLADYIKIGATSSSVTSGTDFTKLQYDYNTLAPFSFYATFGPSATAAGTE
jgi:hypothetical protein